MYTGDAYQRALEFSMIKKSLVVMAMLATSSQATATLLPGDVTPGAVILDYTSAPFLAAHGPGSPSVAYNPEIDRYYLVFEYWSATPDTICPQGIWGLGMAYKDGFNGSWVVEQQPILTPQPGSGTWYSCVAAHPTLIWETNPGTGNIDYNSLRAFIKGEQDTDVCVGLNPNQLPSWGCDRYTGLGTAQIELFNNTHNFKRTRVSPNQELTLPGQEFGFNNVIQKTNGQYILLVAMDNGEHLIEDRTYDIYTADSFSLTGGWWLDPVPTMTVDLNSTWFPRELFTPEMTCMGDGSLQVLMGGRRWGATNYVVAEGGWAQSYSADGYNWSALPVTPTVSWFNTNDWRHLTALAYGDDDLWIIAAEKSGGMLQLREYFAGNLVGTPRDRRCE